MRVLMSGFVVAVALSVAAWFILQTVQTTVYQAFNAASVRLGDPGSNLVGESWTGRPRVTAQERHAATVDSKAGTVD